MASQHFSVQSNKTKIPKTLVLVPHLSLPGGVSNYYRTLRLEDDRNITYFTINAEKRESIFNTFLRLVRNYCKFISKLITDRYQVIVINPSLDEGKSFHRDLVFILITHIFSRTSIIFFRGWFEPYEEKIKKSKLKSFLFRISYARADKFLVLGQVFKNKLIGLGVPPTTKFFIETTVADSSYLQFLDLNKKYMTYEKEIVFLFLSRIEKEKGIYIAIDAFSEFLTKFPERKSNLIIAGDGRDIEDVKAYVSKNNIRNIRFLGNVSAEKKREVLIEAHIMIFPSFTEGLPNVLLEGMLYGMPILSRSTGGIPEVVKNGMNGFLTESYDSSVFCYFISLLAFIIILYKEMAEKNHQLSLEQFTSEKVRERIITIFGEREQVLN